MEAPGESRLRATRIESQNHLGRIDEGVTAIGFDDPRFELALGASSSSPPSSSTIDTVTVAPSGMDVSCSSAIAPWGTVAVNLRAISRLSLANLRTSGTGDRVAQVLRPQPNPS